MASSPPPDESPFSTLPTPTKHRIDNAFNSIVNPPQPSHARKKRKTHHDVSGNQSIPSGFIDAPGGFVLDDVQPGGFIVDDDDDSFQAGGFVPDSSDLHDLDSDSSPQSQPSHIPLSLIPTALQLLSIPPDDPEILSVFQNAASGWKTKGSSSEWQGFGEEEAVSIDDWRAVCAVLLEGAAAGEDEGEEIGMNEEESDGGSDGEEYQEDEDNDTSEPSSDDEYIAGASERKSKSKSKPDASRRRASSSASSSPGPLTTRQTRSCRLAFSLFFPSIPDSDLDQQKITIRDIDRVAKLLKEKIKAEEVRFLWYLIRGELMGVYIVMLRLWKC